MKADLYGCTSKGLRKRRIAFRRGLSRKGCIPVHRSHLCHYSKPFAASWWSGLMAVKLLWSTSVSLPASLWPLILIGFLFSWELLYREAVSGVREDNTLIHTDDTRTQGGHFLLSHCLILWGCWTTRIWLRRDYLTENETEATQDRNLNTKKWTVIF